MYAHIDINYGGLIATKVFGLLQITFMTTKCKTVKNVGWKMQENLLNRTKVRRKCWKDERFSYK